MSYKSDAQRKFFHTATARKKGISEETVEEFDQATKGMKLPKRKDPAPEELQEGAPSQWRRK